MPTSAVDSPQTTRPRWLRGLVIVAVVLGIVLRLTNVSHKAVGLDEGWTALRISGYGDRDASSQLVTGQIVSNRDLQRFQFPGPDRGSLDMVQHLAHSTPELPPPYFLMLRGWAELFGQTITSLRLFSVTLSILLIPAVYWLGRELFPRTEVGAIAMALVAQSPFHLLYGQEANPYSLWALWIVLSSAALVRASRQSSAWALYSLTVALGLYSHAFHVLVLIAHSGFIARQEWGQQGNSLRRGRLRQYVIASLWGCLLFTPWILFALVNFDGIQASEATAEINEVAAQSLSNIGLHPWLPAVLGLQLLTAFVLSRWLSQGPRHWGQLLLIGLLSMGVISNGVMVMSWAWWSKAPEINANLELPALIRQHEQRQTVLPENSAVNGAETNRPAPQPPLFVSDASWRYAMAASHALPDQAQWLLVPPGQQPLVPSNYQNFYLYAPTSELLGQMQRQYQVEPLNDAYWHVSRS